MTPTCGCGFEHGAGTTTGAAEPRGSTLTLGDTVEMAMKRVPGARAGLRELGIDTCCGGSLTLAQAAASAGITAERVLGALTERATTP
jgi:regulator of cell morphogenesis and NO signaling